MIAAVKTLSFDWSAVSIVVGTGVPTGGKLSSVAVTAGVMFFGGIGGGSLFHGLVAGIGAGCGILFCCCWLLLGVVVLIIIVVVLIAVVLLLLIGIVLLLLLLLLLLVVVVFTFTLVVGSSLLV